MKVVAITGERQVTLVDRPRPKAAEDFAIVKIHVVPMCTEYKAYKAGHPCSDIGHEAAGEVIEVAQPGKVKAGDRVVVMPQYPCGRCALCLSGHYIHCQQCPDPHAATGNVGGTGTYAEYLMKPDWLLVPIPDDLSTEHASMACCGLGPTFSAMNLMRVDSFDTVLITGLGPVGLGGVVNGVCRGARVIGVEPHPFRAKLALELGASKVVNPSDPDALRCLMGETRGRGVDKAIDCSGDPGAQRLMIDATRRRGEVSFVGEAGALTLKVSDDLIRKGLTLRGIWHYPLSDAPRMMDLIRKAAPLLDMQITHRFPMARVQDAFELQMTGACGKVLLDPSI